MIDHMDIESTCIHKDSEEAQIQLQMDSNATGLSFDIMNFSVNKILFFPEKCNIQFICYIFVFRIKSSGTENS